MTRPCFFTGFSISIVESQALSSVWDALDDINDSYVRSSAWQALAYIIDNPRLWAELRDKQKLTEVTKHRSSMGVLSVT